MNQRGKPVAVHEWSRAQQIYEAREEIMENFTSAPGFLTICPFQIPSQAKWNDVGHIRYSSHREKQHRFIYIWIS